MHPEVRSMLLIGFAGAAAIVGAGSVSIGAERPAPRWQTEGTIGHDDARAQAEQIVEANERATGREFDPAFRRRLVRKLSNSPSLDPLHRIQETGAMPPSFLGESSADLVFTPLDPCRIIDTRLAGGIVRANTTRRFLVAAPELAAQGGEALGCGVPFGPATAVALNIVGVAPSGPGNLVAFAWNDPEPDAPLASSLNFGRVAGQPALANGTIVPICDSAVTSCTYDLMVQGRVSDVHLVVDVVGYFARAYVELSGQSGFGLPLAFGDNYTFEDTDIAPADEVSCMVTATLSIESPDANAADYGSGLGTAVRFADSELVLNDVMFMGGVYSLLPVGEQGTVSKTSVWSLPGGRVYQFGCYINAFGTYVGDTVYCSVAYLCK